MNFYIKWLSIISIIIICIGIFRDKNTEITNIKKNNLLFLGFGSLIILTVSFSLSAPTEEFWKATVGQLHSSKVNSDGIWN